ncbi:MAG: universal stress protein, partial [Caenispirillum sp.]|nr:universal stress protein [Caenispirillum sp.]
RGLAVDVLAVRPSSKVPAEDLPWAESTLRAAGCEARAVTAEGTPAEAIAAHVQSASADLVVMGAYGHSRIRALIIGSTTTETIRTCQVPLLMVH